MSVPPTKRVVLLHCRGALAGLFQIQGCTDQLPNFETTLPPFVDNLNFGNHQGSASLVTVKPRFVLYRENTPKEGGRFDEFHPAQV